MKVLNNVSLLVKEITGSLKEGSKRYKQSSQKLELDNYIEIKKRKNELGRRIIEIKKEMPILESRYNQVNQIALSDPERVIPINIEELNIDVTITQLASLLKTELEKLSNEHDRLIKEVDGLLRFIEKKDKNEFNVKEQDFKKRKTRNIFNEITFDKINNDFIPSLLRLSDKVYDKEVTKENELRVYREDFKVEVSHNNLLIKLDTVAENVKVGQNEDGKIILLAEGNMSNVKDFDWKVELTEELQDKMIKFYKEVQLLLINLEDKEETENKK